jgi:imidazolonepropionase-like amidohydrolase
VDNPHDLIAIVGATLIDGNGGPPINDSVILIEGKRIAAIADCTLQIPNQAQQIAAHGKFVIPGLIDAHVWSLDGTIPTVLIRHEGRYEELVIEAAQLTLKNGVTTLFDGWGPRDVLIKARDAIHSGRVIGSRIYCSGNGSASVARSRATCGSNTEPPSTGHSRLGSTPNGNPASVRD